jgi:hypothetical protein
MKAPSDQDFRDMAPDFEVLETTLRTLVNLRNTYAKVSEVEALHPVVRATFKEIADGLEATIHDASLEWMVAQIKEHTA